MVVTHIYKITKKLFLQGKCRILPQVLFDMSEIICKLDFVDVLTLALLQFLLTTAWNFVKWLWQQQQQRTHTSYSPIDRNSKYNNPR